MLPLVTDLYENDEEDIVMSEDKVSIFSDVVTSVSEAAQKNIPETRSEEHTSELQSLRWPQIISYAVFCL